jgi:hypothetical protein
MSMKSVTLFMCGSLVVGGFTLTLRSAAQDSPVSTFSALALELTQTQEQGDLSSLAGGGEAIAGEGFVEANTDVFDEVVSPDVAEAMNAAIRARQAAARAGRPFPFVPVPKGAAVRLAIDSAPTEAADADTLVQAPNDMTYFVNHDITGTEVPTSQRSTILEPTAVNLDDAILYTANWFAAKSTDGGNTFSYINPYTFFPSANGGFCCDQVTAYAPTQDMALWGLLYIDDGTTNTLRIARAIGGAGIAADSWVYWNFTPQLVGFPNGVWLDYPSFTVGGNNLYVSSNAFLTSNDTFAGNVLMRIPLAELAAGGSISFQYFRSNIGTERITEGAGSTIYWAGFATTSQMRIHRWTEGSGTIFWDNVNLNAFNWLSRDGVATSPDGTNWAARADSRPLGAYVAEGVIGVMWMAKQGEGRPKPYTVHARFSESTRALISQSDIWHPDYAWMYPAVNPNTAGHLAGTLQIGGAASGTFAYPGTQMWITDDVTGPSMTVGGLFFVSAGNDGPNNNAWGDYFSVRPHKTRPRTWVAASHSLQGGGSGSSAVPKYLWFGRERDNATPAEISSPAPGSTLPGTSTTFHWNAGFGASQYWLYVGTTGVGSSNIWNENQGTNTSRTVTGLPINGMTVYVRLWTLLPSGWAFHDYTYTAFLTGCVSAAVTSPAEGSTLAGSIVSFTWNAGAGNTQYWLYVGTTPGGTEIWNENQGTGLTRTVTGIPTNGLAVYVRIWSYCGGWFFRDHTYTATTTASSVTARLTAPAPRSVLAGASQTFTWSAGTGSSQYWLYVGSAHGGSDIWNEDKGSDLSRTVTGIPVDGRRIYVRLWSLASGVWYYVDYDFTAAGTARALLNSPAEGSVLGGTSATFDWSPGTASTQYWVYLGTTPGASNLLNQDMGTATTLAASGLPADRGPVYLRLWSLVSGSWQFNDYVFRAFDGGSIRGRLTGPAPESILTGSSHTFVWSAGSGSTQYWIYIGTSRGASDLLNQNMGTTLSVAVTGLPVNGSTIYVRLWSLESGWVFNDYEYAAAP